MKHIFKWETLGQALADESSFYFKPQNQLPGWMLCCFLRILPRESSKQVPHIDNWNFTHSVEDISFLSVLLCHAVVIHQKLHSPHLDLSCAILTLSLGNWGTAETEGIVNQSLTLKYEGNSPRLGFLIQHYQYVLGGAWHLAGQLHNGRAGEHQRTRSGDIIPYTGYSDSPEKCLWLNFALSCSQWSRQWSTNTKLSLFFERGKMHPPDFSEQMYLASHFSQLLETSEMQKETHLRRERQAKTMELTQYGSGKILFRLELVKARSLREAVVLTARQYHKVGLGRRVQSLGFLRRHFFFL